MTVRSLLGMYYWKSSTLPRKKLPDDVFMLLDKPYLPWNRLQLEKWLVLVSLHVSTPFGFSMSINAAFGKRL
jgi:hypothetical protein